MSVQNPCTGAQSAEPSLLPLFVESHWGFAAGWQALWDVPGEHGEMLSYAIAVHTIRYCSCLHVGVLQFAQGTTPEFAKGAGNCKRNDTLQR